MENGVLIISVDLELAWGFNYELLKGSKTAVKYLKIINERSRRNVRKLLKLSERFNILLTWGIVGHLFLSSCGNNLPHPDMPRPKVDIDKDWYVNDPCSNVNKAPLWYGSDIVKQILESNVEHEIASHSFSHVDFSKCSREVALAEIRKCKEVMGDYDISPKSFIFPKNRIGHIDILKSEGFKTFRFVTNHSNRNSCPEHRPSLLLAPFNMAQESIFPATGAPIKVNGLCGIPCSLGFQSRHIIFTLSQQIAALRGINKVVNKKAIFHITAHDYLETDYLLNTLLEILSYAAKLRDKSKLHITTMLGSLNTY